VLRIARVYPAIDDPSGPDRLAWSLGLETRVIEAHRDRRESREKRKSRQMRERSLSGDDNSLTRHAVIRRSDERVFNEAARSDESREENENVAK
jgi:hypothetical protein